MRLLAVRNKARDVRFAAVGLFGLAVFIDGRWNASPLVGGVLLASGVLLTGFAFVLRAWAVLYIAGYKTERLITQGPFSICRNPIYLSTLMGAFGIALDTGTFSLPLFVLLGGASYLHVQIRGEERKLLEKHGPLFEAYCRRTPRLVPDFRLLDQPSDYVVRPAAFQRWLADALWFIWGIGIVELIEALHETGVLPVLWHVY